MVDETWHQKNAKWRMEFGFENLNPESDEIIRSQIAANKVIFTEEKDKLGRFVQPGEFLPD